MTLFGFLDGLGSRLLGVLHGLYDALTNLLLSLWRMLEPILLGALVWLWDRVKQVFSKLQAWVLAGVTAILAFLEPIQELTRGVFDEALTMLADLSPFTAWVLVEVLAVDVLWSCVCVYFGVVLLLLASRFAFMAIKALLEVF